MRTLVIAQAQVRDLLRNPVIVLLALGLGPFFVLLISLFFPSGGSTTYPVAVVAAAQPADRAAVAEARAALAGFSNNTGAPILQLVDVADSEQARRAVEEHSAIAWVGFPDGFASAIAAADVDAGIGIPVAVGGDQANPLYPVAAIMVHQALADHLGGLTARTPVIDLTEVAIGNSSSRTEFESSVPGILIFAIGLIIFTSASAVAQEVESGTIRRLARTPLRAAEVLGGIGIVQATIGLLAGALSLATAIGLGFRAAGSLPLIVLVWFLTSLSVIGLGLVVGALSATVSQAFIAANLPFGVFMFLSGTMFPVRGIALASIAGQEVNLLDLLPPRHAVNALTSLVTYGSADIGYELAMLTALSLGYFALGAWLFGRRQLRMPG
jgi:ABC-2 type transport system permease protein